MERFLDFPLEVRRMIYRYTPLNEDFLFDLKEIEESGEVNGPNPEAANLYEASLDFKKQFRFQYLMQFSAIVERGGEEDIVQFDPEIEYFDRNNITHFGKFTCDYETGYVYDGDGGRFARGKIEVEVDYRRNVTVTGDADCDHSSYNVTNWQWFQELRTEIEEWVREDEVGLISWGLMEYINAQLEAEVEHLRARSGDDEEDENEDEDEVEEGENDSDEQQSESGEAEDEDEA